MGRSQEHNQDVSFGRREGALERMLKVFLNKRADVQHHLPVANIGSSFGLEQGNQACMYIICVFAFI